MTVREKALEMIRGNLALIKEHPESVKLLEEILADPGKARAYKYEGVRLNYRGVKIRYPDNSDRLQELRQEILEALR